MSSQGSSAVVKMKSKRITNYKGADKKQEISIVPKNDNQRLYIEALQNSPQVISMGPAGTGKTFLVASHAASRYLTKDIDKIIITRPHVAVGKELGFLKGGLEEKTLPWALPVLDVLQQRLGKGTVDTAIKNGNIEVAPMAMMRGRSFDNAYIIIDEAQNMTVAELKMVVTRVGENCTIVINGDIKQSDIRETSGLAKAVHLVKKYNMDAPVIEFGIEDIVRSDVCKQWIIAFDAEGL
jgi:phosphate starvation-inducible PhoH-like protein